MHRNAIALVCVSIVGWVDWECLWERLEVYSGWVGAQVAWWKTEGGREVREVRAHCVKCVEMLGCEMVTASLVGYTPWNVHRRKPAGSWDQRMTHANAALGII